MAVTDPALVLELELLELDELELLEDRLLDDELEELLELELLLELDIGAAELTAGGGVVPPRTGQRISRYLSPRVQLPSSRRWNRSCRHASRRRYASISTAESRPVGRVGYSRS